MSVEVPAPGRRGKAPEGGAAASRDDGDGPTLTRAGFWVALVGTLASAGAGVKFGLDVRDINSQLDPYRRFPCPGTATQALRRPQQPRRSH